MNWKTGLVIGALVLFWGWLVSWLVLLVILAGIVVLIAWLYIQAIKTAFAPGNGYEEEGQLWEVDPPPPPASPAGPTGG